MQIDLSEINPSTTARPVNELDAQSLAADILDRISRGEDALINPIQVREIMVGYSIVAGGHRYRAHQIAGLKTIECKVLDLPFWRYELIEIAENLRRTELSAPMRASQTARYVELLTANAAIIRDAQCEPLEKLTKDGKKVGKNAPPKKEKSVITQTAEAAGVDRMTVRRDVARAENLGHETLKAIDGTSLGTGRQMDALAKMPEPERAALVERAQAGEKVSAVPEKQPADDCEESDAQAEILADYERMIRILDADEPLKTALSEVKKLESLIQVLNGTIAEKMNTIAAEKNLNLTLNRRVLRLEKQVAAYNSEKIEVEL